MKISELDKNLAVQSELTEKNENLVFLDALDAPIQLTGAAEPYVRVPRKMIETMRPGLAWLSQHTSGIRVRFRTDSPYIVINATLPSVDLMCHMPLTGSSGFDVYVGDTFENFAAPATITTTHFEKMIHFVTKGDEDGFRDITINFPLYNRVTSLSIGFDKTKSIQAPKKQKYGKVAFYGSSITQGGCAARPGNNYSQILARWLDFEPINLGYSGNAFGDQITADYIASLDLDAFMMDYDFNARSLEELETTHEPFFKTIRAKQPNTPIIFISNPVSTLMNREEEGTKRKEIILKTYNNAKAGGDENVWFVDGFTLLDGLDPQCCTVDNLHPTDLGFLRMAEHCLPTLREALEKNAKNK